MSSQEYAGLINSGKAPWIGWSDSTKEQYFNLLNNELANERELQMWHLNNEYNSPRAQMERMIEAGINPAAAYSNVNGGNSSAVPNTHEAKSANYHDTQDKLSTINSIMNGVSSIMSTIYGGVDAVKGLQDIQLRYQNNWYDKIRADYWNNSDVSPQYWVTRDKNFFPKNVEIAPGLYMEAGIAQMFPEFLQGFKNAYTPADINIKQGNQAIQKQLAERRTRIDKLIQDIFKGLENNASNSEMIRLFMELFAYSAMSKYGGY